MGRPRRIKIAISPPQAHKKNTTLHGAKHSPPFLLHGGPFGENRSFYKMYGLVTSFDHSEETRGSTDEAVDLGKVDIPLKFNFDALFLRLPFTDGRPRNKITQDDHQMMKI